MLTLPGHVVVSDLGPWRGYGGAITFYPDKHCAAEAAKSMSGEAERIGAGSLRTAPAELRIGIPQSSQSTENRR